MANNLKKPSWIHFLLASILIIGGFAGYSIMLFVNLVDARKSDQKVVLPAEQELDFPEVGLYTIYYEFNTTLDGQIIRNPESPPTMQISLTSKSSPENKININAMNYQSTYTIGNNQGTGVFEFEVTESGTYLFKGSHSGGKEYGPVVLVVGKGMVETLYKAVLSPCIIIGITFPVGVIWIIIVGIKRSRASRLENQQPE